MRFSRKGNIGINKLILILIGIVVLVLLAWMVGNGVVPSVEKMESLMVDVGDKLSFWEGVDSNCYSESVSSYTDGEEFLENLGLEGGDVRFGVCGGVCNLSGSGVGPYRVRGGKFEKFVGESWVDWDVEFEGDAFEVKRNWEFYHAGIDFLESLSLRGVYDGAKTGSFVLYGDGSGMIEGDEVYAIWRDGVWRVIVGDEIKKGVGDWYKDETEDIDADWVKRTWAKDVWFGFKQLREFKIYTTRDTEKAIDVFVGVVWGAWYTDDDKVYWKVVHAGEYDDLGYGESIDSLLEISGGKSSGDYDEIDSDLDVFLLKSESQKIIRELISESKLSEKEVDNFRNAVEGKGLRIGDESFLLGVEDGGGFPIISFDYDGEKYGFRKVGNFDSDGEISENRGVRYFSIVEYFPIELVVLKDGVWVSVDGEEYYRMYKEQFKEAYEAILASEFLKKRCRG